MYLQNIDVVCFLCPSSPIRTRYTTCFLNAGGLWSLISAYAVPLLCDWHNVVGWATLNFTAYLYLRSIDSVILSLSAPVMIRYTDLLFSSLEDYGLLYMPGLCHCLDTGTMWSARRAIILLPTYIGSK